jgi:hypothetical protein
MITSSAQIPQGYDPITLNHFLWYKYHCHECSSSEFQRLFESIIKRSKPEFMQIRPYGNIGDRKCDGLFLADRKVFQVYSPDDLKLAELKAKIEEDLRLAVCHWREQLELWTFVYNARRGLAPDVPQLLSAQGQLYPKLILDHLSSDALWEIARSLTLQQRCEVLGAPNGYEHLFLSSAATDSEIRKAIENGWFVIVHDTMTPISLSAVVDALKPSQPFGAPIYVRPEISSRSWTAAADYQRSVLLEAIERSRDVLPRFAVFSLSQIPLCIHLGFVLSDRLDVRCFQFDRDRRTWQWPDDAETADTNISVSGMPTRTRSKECETVIRISLSATVAATATRAAAGGHPVEIDIRVPTPDVMWLRSPRQLSVLGQTFRCVLAELREKVPNCTRVHLFYAGPTGGAVVIGQQINPRMNPPVELYEYSRHTNPNHQRVLTLDEETAE